MMENSKVNTMVETDSERRLLNAIYGKSIMSYRDRWLDKECPVINQSDFDTCGNSYSDGDYQVRHLNGYDKEFRTYMNQFEN